MKDFIVSVFVAYYVVALLVAPWLDRRENRNRSAGLGLGAGLSGSGERQRRKHLHNSKL